MRETYFAAAHEMTPYMTGYDTRAVGSVGKSGYLHLGFELDGNGKSILRDLERHVPLIVQQALYFDEELPDMPCVYILSSGGPNVDGDRYEQNFIVRRNAQAFISTGAATKLAEMQHNFSGLQQNIILEEGAYLEYLPEPIIPCRHTRYISDTRLCIASTATLTYAEIYTGGRKYYNQGELFRYDILSICVRGERPDGNLLFREKMTIRPQAYLPCVTGIMADYDLFANVVVMTPPEHQQEIYDKTEAFIDREKRLAAGITRLPNGCGLLYKVLGCSTEQVKKKVREFASAVRISIKGKPLPQEFPWR